MEESKEGPIPSEVLYDRCSKFSASSTERTTFNQDALLALCNECKDLAHITDARRLMPLIQELSNEGLFISLKAKSGSFWTIRRRDAAAKYRDLSGDERLVYGLIEESHEQGIWIRNLKNKTGIKDGKAMDKMLSHMSNLHLIKNVKNVKAPAQKHYMLYHLAPSDEITGGSFYDAGDLDESLIDELSNLIVFHVRQMSWVDERKKRIKRDTSPILIRDNDAPLTDGGKDTANRKKRKRDPNTTSNSKDIEDMPPPRKHRSNKHAHEVECETLPSQSPFAAGHEYQTAASIHKYITSNNIIRAVKAQYLTEDEVQNVLNVLVWDGKLEEVNGGYRTVRGVKFRQPGELDDPEEDLARQRGNGLTEMPCGQCPVLDICGNGGPVNAEGCVYFDRWLGVGVAAEAY